MASTSARPVGNFETLLGISRQALRDGDADTCRQAAKSALDLAQESKDLHQEARAHLSLAQADRMLAQSRRAQLSGQRAAFLFQLCGDGAGEAEALAVLAYTLSVLGRNEEAIKAALLSVKLSEQCATEAALANSYTYLGIAYSHCSGFQEADHAFNTAIRLLEQHDRLSDACFPRLHQRAMESMRVFHERYYTGELPTLGRLSELRLASAPHERDAAFADALQLACPRTQTMRHLLAGLEHCWPDWSTAGSVHCRTRRRQHGTPALEKATAAAISCTRSAGTGCAPRLAGPRATGSRPGSAPKR